MQYLVKAINRQKRITAYEFIEANTEQQAIDYAIVNCNLKTTYSFVAQKIELQNASMHRNTVSLNQIGSQFLVA